MADLDSDFSSSLESSSRELPSCDEWSDDSDSSLKYAEQDGIVGHEREPLPPSQQDPGSNIPTGNGEDGQWTHVRFVPAWTAPDWNDEPVMAITVKGKPVKIARRDYTQMIRPALLPGDAIPTPYALRYGIHPEHNRGRSRLSPTESRTRGLNLSLPQNTYTGLKNYVDIQDVSKAIEMGGGTIVKFLELVNKLPANDPGHEHRFATREVWDMMRDDEQYQKALFSGLTTDERIRHNIHNLEPGLVPQSTLGGDLHPLLRKKRWCSTDYRGDDEDDPRVVFNLCGNVGEYSADNELVWMALQPALHLVTNILNSNHPAWKAILDLYSRRPVHASRVPYRWNEEEQKFTQPELYAVFDQFSCPPASTQVEKLKRNTTLDVAAAAAEYLEEHLFLEMTSAYLSGNAQTGKKKPAWGSALNDEDFDRTGSYADAKIRIEIASEMIWPLLVPDYTMAEKATSSLTIATTLLHELAHAAHMAVQNLFQVWKTDCKKIPQLAELQTLDPPTTALFTEATRCIMRDAVNEEPFYREEQRAELGWAFEKQLFGGTIAGFFPTSEGGKPFPLLQFGSTDISMGEWPWSCPDPHGKTGSNVLAQPPLPVDSFTRSIQMTDTGRLFQKSFWETNAAKYGHRALRLGANDLGVVTMQPKTLAEGDRVKALGIRRAGFLETAMSILNNVGQTIVAMFLDALIHERVGPLAMRRRLDQHAKVWPTRDEEARRLSELCEKEYAAINQCLELAKTSDEEKRHRLAMQAPQQHHTLDEYKQHLLQKTYSAAESLLFACVDLHQFMIVQIQQVQHLVVEYLQLKPAARAPMYKSYISFVHNRLNLVYETAASDVARMLTTACRELQDVKIASKEMVEMFTNMINKLETDENHFKDARKYLTKAYVRNTDRIPAVFSSVPKAAYERRQMALEKLAFRELKYMPPGLRQMVDKCFKIFQVTVPPELANEPIDPWLAHLLASSPPVPPAAPPPAPTPPNPTTVTNMAATTLPQLSDQLRTALHLPPNPQPQPPPTFPPTAAPLAQLPAASPFGPAPSPPSGPAPNLPSGPTWGTFGVNDANKYGVASWMRDTMFGGPAYFAEQQARRQAHDAQIQAQMPGQTLGQGPVPGQTPGQTLGQGPVQGPVPGQTLGQTPGPVQGPVQGPVPAQMQMPTQTPAQMQMPTQTPAQMQMPTQTPAQMSAETPGQKRARGGTGSGSGSEGGSEGSPPRKKRKP